MQQLVSEARPIILTPKTAPEDDDDFEEDEEDQKRIQLKFKQIYLQPPTSKELDGSLKLLYPNQARLRHLTYSSCIFADLKQHNLVYDPNSDEWVVESK